jgi:hypothetical protein
MIPSNRLSHIALVALLFCVTGPAYAQMSVNPLFFTYSGTTYSVKAHVGEAFVIQGATSDVLIRTGFLERHGRFSTSVEDGTLSIPDRFQLGSSYPNPFNPTTTIPYDVPELAAVRLEVWDMLGRRVSVLVDRAHQPGSYVAQFRAAGNASGVYHILLFKDNQLAFTSKVTLLK